MRVREISINGWLAGRGMTSSASYEDAEPQRSESSGNNSWNVNLGNGNVNNNNKNNSYCVRPCTEFVDFESFEMSMWQAYDDCLRGKRGSVQALEYMPQAADDIPLLAREVWERRYEPRPSTCFMVTYPKLREVFAADFRDRIIHHWICLRLLPLFEARCHALGDVSHACRKGYGTRTAIRQVQEGMLSVSDHLQREAWVYKGDIVGFFMSIDKRLLWDALRELIGREYRGEDMDTLLYLVEKTVMHHPEKSCRVKSAMSLWRQIEARKSLFFVGDSQGEPIGNLTTQLFAGFYLSQLDEYVEEVMRGRVYSYTRSVDDFIIICDDRDFLRHAIRQTGDFTRAQLGLEVHRDKVYFQPVSHGVKFLGQWIYPHRRYVINRTIGRMTDRVKECVEECRQGMTEIRAGHWAQVLNSYFGFLSQADEYRTRGRIQAMLPGEWFRYFIIENRRKVITRKRIQIWKK